MYRVINTNIALFWLFVSINTLNKLLQFSENDILVEVLEYLG